MDGFKRRTEQKKESIRRAAIELYKVSGFSKVSINDIARQANVSHVTIYNHFGSKEDLIRDIIKTVLTDMIEKSREIIESDIPYLEKINQLILSKSSVAGQYQGELIKMVARDLPEMKHFMRQIREQETDRLTEKLIEEGKKLKYIKQDISPQSISYYFQIIRNGIYADQELLNSIKIDTKLAQDLNYLWLFGLIEKQE
jgi:TetR/AcrR family transcriptional regulator, cholesterol catabolism regulator